MALWSSNTTYNQSKPRRWKKKSVGRRTAKGNTMSRLPTSQTSVFSVSFTTYITLTYKHLTALRAMIVLKNIYFSNNWP